MNDFHTAAVPDDAATLLANHHFDILNALSLQCWFVDIRSRATFISGYMEFIQAVGAVRFDDLAILQERAANCWSNNVAFRKLLQKELQYRSGARSTLASHLEAYPWIGHLGAQGLVQRALACNRPDWVEAKAAFIDRLPISDADKASRLSHELDAALVAQESQPPQIVSPLVS